MFTSKLSLHKQLFLQNPAEAAHQMRAAQCAAIAEHYRKKYEIDIRINGQSEEGIELIAKNFQYFSDLLSNLQDPELKYYAFFQRLLFIKPRDLTVPLFPWPQLLEQKRWLLSHDFPKDLESTLQSLELNYQGKGNLNESQIEGLNFICQSHKKKLDEMISQYIEMMNKSVKNIGLSNKDAAREIQFIQKTLEPGQRVGYIFTNNCSERAAHFEVVIITSDKIIKPLQWGEGPNTIEVRDLDRCYFPNTFSPIVEGVVSYNEREQLPLAQADQVSCGTLGFLYLKELLQDDAKQLTEDSFMFSYYQGQMDDDSSSSSSDEEEGESFESDSSNDDGEDVEENFINATRPNNLKLLHFYFPSPQVLRYSQSEAFNKIILAMLADDSKPQEVMHKHKHEQKTYKVTPIKSLLLTTLATANQNDDHDLAKETQAALDALPAFRKKWLSAYKEMTAKRAQLHLSANNKNGYLLYSTHRLDHITEYPIHIHQLNLYIQNRENRRQSSEREYYSIWGALFGYSATTKISAAQKMKNLLEYKPIEPFTANELSALREGELGKIISTIQHLPSEFLEAESALRAKEFVHLHASK